MSEIKNLEITDVEVWNTSAKNKNIGIRLYWSCNLGFGAYTIGLYKGKWYIDDECMESPEDREFGKLVLNTWLNSLKDNPKYTFGNNRMTDLGEE